MSEEDQVRSVGQTVLDLQNAKRELAALESKAQFMAQDCAFIAELLTADRDPVTGGAHFDQRESARGGRYDLADLG